MGKYFNGEGKLNPLQMLMDLGEDLAEIAAENSGEALKSVSKAAVVTTGAVGAGAAISTGGTGAAAAVGGAALGTVVVNEALKENGVEPIEVTRMESPEGGISPEELGKLYAVAQNESPQIAQAAIEKMTADGIEPFAVFQQGLKDTKEMLSFEEADVPTQLPEATPGMYEHQQKNKARNTFSPN